MYLQEMTKGRDNLAFSALQGKGSGPANLMVRGERDLARWSDIVRENYVTVDCDNPTCSPLEVDMSKFAVGPAHFFHVQSSQMTYTRSQNAVRTDPRDDLQITLVKKGMMAIEQRGRVAMLQPGEFAMYDSRAPFQLTYPQENDVVTLKLPLSIIASRAPGVLDLTAIPVRADGLGAIAGAMLTSFVENVEQIDVGQRLSTASTLIDLIASAIHSGIREYDGNAPPPERMRKLLQVQEWIDQHLDDPELDATKIAKAHGLTTRTLIRLFALEGTTPIRWLNRRRLDAAHRAITSGSVASVTEACFAFGFNEVTHFGRSFRRQYGLRPSDLFVRSGPSSN